MNTVSVILKKLKSREELSRDEIIIGTSSLSIAVNFAISCIKLITGLLTSSIAIFSEGVNSAADVLSSLLALIGTKLAAKNPDEKHPFGYGRIEYLTGLVISVIILVAGIEMLRNSIELIIKPEPIDISYISLIIVAVSAVIKFFMGSFMIKIGKNVTSSAIEAVGRESKSDSFVSIVTIAAALAYLVGGVTIDAYAAAITSLFIIKAGAEVLKETIADLIGRPGEKELAETLYSEIRATKGIINAADMMLHNYGPDAYSGSVNIEIDHKATIGEIYQYLHKLQLNIMHKHHVTMVFGIYAVDNDNEKIKEIRNHIAAFIRNTEHLKSYHALYLDQDTDTLYCDFIVDYKLRDWDGLREGFESYIKGFYPSFTVDLTVETEFV